MEAGGSITVETTKTEVKYMYNDYVENWIIIQTF